MSIFEEGNGKRTMELLNYISSRLSGRDDCKNVNYIVTIDHTGIRMSPMVNVYPNRYRRHESDKLDVISYIHMYKMPDALTSDFVFGTYQYQSSFDNKRRRWTRIS